MNVSLYQAAAALDANTRWQEIIAENLAASSVPGFKRQEITFEAVRSGRVPDGASLDAAKASALTRATFGTNFSQGELRYTGVPTDVAIEGTAFFAVQLPSGETGYTRNGEFHLNDQGQLVTKENYPVLSDAGPVQLDLNNRSELSISHTGEVSQGIDEKGRLRLVEFSDPRMLTQIGSGYFLAGPDAQATPAGEPSVRQHYLEASNASAVTEMANLLIAMRSFEANQKLIQSQDERMARTISELAGPT